MARSGLMLIALIAVIMAVLLQEVSALKCWECKENQLDCRDPFDPQDAVGKVNQEQCKPEKNDPAVCIKVKKSSDEVRRACSTKQSVALGCTLDKVGSFQCEMCETDLCNDGVQYGPVFTAISLLVVIASILSL